MPYRVTNFNHVMVRAKINGQGPFNFIVDTGTPALFVADAVADKIGVKKDKKGWGTFDTFEIEGGDGRALADRPAEPAHHPAHL